MSFHLRVKSAGVLAIKICRKIMFDFKIIIHQTKPICDFRNVTWLVFCFQKHMIYPGPGGSAKYGKTECQCNEVQIISVPTKLVF